MQKYLVTAIDRHGWTWQAVAHGEDARTAKRRYKLDMALRGIRIKVIDVRAI